MCDGIAGTGCNRSDEIVSKVCGCCGTVLTYFEVFDLDECPYCDNGILHYMEAVKAQQPTATIIEAPPSLEEQIKEGWWDEIPF